MGANMGAHRGAQNGGIPAKGHELKPAKGHEFKNPVRHLPLPRARSGGIPPGSAGWCRAVPGEPQTPHGAWGVPPPVPCQSIARNRCRVWRAAQKKSSHGFGLPLARWMPDCPGGVPDIAPTPATFAALGAKMPRAAFPHPGQVFARLNPGGRVACLSRAARRHGNAARITGKWKTNPQARPNQVHHSASQPCCPSSTRVRRVRVLSKQRPNRTTPPTP